LPFTPFHFGPVLLAGVILFPFFDIAAIMISSVILDVEPLLIIIFDLGGPLHGIFHTYLLATVVAFIVSIVLWLLRNPISSVVSIFGIKQEPKKHRILLASIFGTYSHVFMDSFLYPEMNPFFPLLGNPFLGLIASSLIYQFCTICGIIGIIIYLGRFCRMSSKESVRVDGSPW
jgi:hypothetical protein